MKITFLLPGDSASGGTRVTMQMGNCLIKRGHNVRIAYERGPLCSQNRFLSAARSLKYRLLGMTETLWLSQFQGRKEPFARVDQLEFTDKEIVVATGEATNDKLQQLPANLFKLRYCHGFIERDPERMRLAWGGPMRTIAVSARLVPTLKQYCESPILGIVPNGLSSNEYFVNGGARQGTGLIFSGHPIKGPEVAIAVVNALGEQFRETPCYVFGSYPKPGSLGPCVYTRFPSIQMAREIYNRCKVWLVTSRDEGFSLPILEAMACGCAVVTSNHTNAADLIQDGVNGFVVGYGDVRSYLDRIGRLLGDEGLRTRVVEEGFKTVKRFSWENATDRMEEALKRLNGCV